MNSSVRMGKLPSPQGSGSHGFCERRSPPTPSQEPAPFPCPACFPRRPDQPHPVDGQPSFPREGCPTLFSACNSSILEGYFYLCTIRLHDSGGTCPDNSA